MATNGKFYMGLFLILAVVGLSSCQSPDDSSDAVPFLKKYAAQFDLCDRENIFNGRLMKGNKRCRNPNPKKRDLNKLSGFSLYPNGAVSFDSKLSVDVDGGYAPCNARGGQTDQCPTTYNYRKLSRSDRTLPEWRRKYVTSDLVPYIVIPYDSRLPGRPNDPDSTEFRRLTKIKIGDVGVVIAKGKVIPVLVADGGPHNKIGEGSLALFDKIGSTRCEKRLPSNPKFCEIIKNYSLGRTVKTIIFPNSSIKDLTPSNTNALVSKKALELYRATVQQ